MTSQWKFRNTYEKPIETKKEISKIQYNIKYKRLGSAHEYTCFDHESFLREILHNTRVFGPIEWMMLK